MSILALSYGVVMQVFAGAARSADTAGAYRRALVIAESRLATIRAGYPVTDTPPGSDEDYRVTVSAEPYASGLPSSHYRTELVTVDVSWSGGRRASHTVSLSTVRLRAGGQR